MSKTVNKPQINRIIKNDVHGKPVDKLTSEQLKAQNEPFVSIYNQDIGGKIGTEKGKIQQIKGQKLSQEASSNQSLAVQAPVVAKTDSKQVVSQKSDAGSNNNNKLAENGSKVVFDEKNKYDTVKSAGSMGNSDFNRRTNYSVYDIEAVHNDVKKSYLENPKLKHDPEAEYYETVRRLDVCGNCWAQNRKYCTHPFKLREKGPGQSLYQKDYVEHPIQKGPVMKNDFYTTFNVDEPMDLLTTMKNDYKDWGCKAPPRAHMEANGKSAVSGVPFGAKSGYKNDYINWGNMPVNLEKAPHNITTIKDLPFNSKSAYQENFGAPKSTDQARPVDRDLWNKNKKSPLSTGIPFLGQTTSGQTYKPYKVGNVPSFNTKDEYEPTEAYPGQFGTTYKGDYIPHDKWKCPAKIFMETHPHPRENAISS